MFKKTTYEVPATKLFKSLNVGLLEKYTGEATMCWSTLLYFLKSNSFTTKTNLFRLFSAGLIEKKNKRIKQNKLMIYLLFVKLYFSTNFN